MKRRFVATLLLCILTFSLVSTAEAAEARASIAQPTLSFTGTTANCKFGITKFGSNINATLELWKGTTRIASWPATATSSLMISKTKTVTRGATYTLKAYGTTVVNAVIPAYYVDATEYQIKWKLTYGSTTAYMTGWKYKFYHVRIGETQYAYDGNYYTRSNYTNHSASLANTVYPNMPLYWGGDGRVEVVSWG